MKHKCDCGYYFTDNKVPLENGLIAFNHSRFQNLLYEKLRTDEPRNKTTDIIRLGIEINQTGRLIYLCPKCHRIHIIWENGYLVTYKPESESYIASGTDIPTPIEKPTREDVISAFIEVDLS